MMQFLNKIILLLFFVAGTGGSLCAQNTDSIAVRDTLPAKTDTAAEAKAALKHAAKTREKYIDTIARKDPRYRSPGKAALRSAVLPGWGQVYNRKVWKVPIVYAALGATGGLFVNNLVWYKRLRAGFIVATDFSKPLKEGEVRDSTGYFKLDKYVQKIFFGQNSDRYEVLRSTRDEYRKSVDYSFVFFLIAWGLNVMDASVDAHLSTFDVSPKLSLRVQPGFSEMANTNGLSLVMRIK
ncbi:DUF5683 domain-containing protein [Niabella drilacis]|uniref:DUF5683 domain-containing protein n=1 Tax=Niabella drilacis (strain DSM 25811 / CCM 8410 / CCUG 62505 / LMG 26954 / E90) TaxID=1285928 RepID=A0A1G6VGI8_NIADE|nr:DUF5683 domain-containing protein [Niabella drilacis]SDD52473.1 hypothetical protein SAMN04487894_1107 [Niabella drilacis]